jgi:hypothetical protein
MRYVIFNPPNKCGENGKRINYNEPSSEIGGRGKAEVAQVGAEG